MTVGFNVKMPIWRDSMGKIHVIECEEVQWECEHESPAPNCPTTLVTNVISRKTPNSGNIIIIIIIIIILSKTD